MKSGQPGGNPVASNPGATQGPSLIVPPGAKQHGWGSRQVAPIADSATWTHGRGQVALSRIWSRGSVQSRSVARRRLRLPSCDARQIVLAVPAAVGENRFTPRTSAAAVHTGSPP